MKTSVPIVAAALGLLAVPVPAGAVGHARHDAKRCGTKTLYGRTLAIRVVGEPLACAKVRRIVRGRCRERRTWSCFSFQPPDPLLVWFREKERFRERWSTAIEARRPSCARTHVSWRRWRTALRRGARGFPSRAQVIADDIVRCKLLRGLTRRQIVRRLGHPDEADRHHLSYSVGLERDSFFQVDGESLVVEVRHGRFRRAEFAQN